MKHLMAHDSFLTDGQLYLLEQINYKVKSHPERFAQPNDHYLENACLIATSDWEDAASFSYCGLYGRRCRKWLLCPFCAYLAKQRALEAYFINFAQSSWHHLRASISKDFKAEPPFHEDVVTIWNTCSHAVRTLRDDGIIGGALTRFELRLSFLPLEVYPHSHSLLEARDASHEAIRAGIRASLGLLAERYETSPDVSVIEVSDERHFANVLSYLYKSQDIADPYMAAIRPGDSDQIFALNMEVEDFLSFLDEVRAGRHLVRSIGSMHHASSGSLRVPKGRRRESREEVEAFFMEQQEEKLIRETQNPRENESEALPSKFTSRHLPANNYN